jgi:hypothetical protein
MCRLPVVRVCLSAKSQPNNSCPWQKSHPQDEVQSHETAEPRSTKCFSTNFPAAGRELRVGTRGWELVDAAELGIVRGASRASDLRSENMMKLGLRNWLTARSVAKP